VSAKTKVNGFIGTLVLAAVVVLGYQFLGPKTGRPDNDRIVIVTGVWLPSPRDIDHVQVVVTTGGSLKVDKAVSLAPFQRSFHVPKGDRVEIKLTLMGMGSASFLGCSISVDGTEVVNEHKEGMLKIHDQVICWAPA
jgi:hypothetical protein